MNLVLESVVAVVRGREVDDRTDGTQRVGERHARAAVKDASGRAKVGANLHQCDDALGGHFDQRDSHESRKKRFEKLLHFGGIHRAGSGMPRASQPPSHARRVLGVRGPELGG